MEKIASLTERSLPFNLSIEALLAIIAGVIVLIVIIVAYKFGKHKGASETSMQTKLTEEQTERLLMAIGKMIVSENFRHKSMSEPRKALRSELGFEVDDNLAKSFKDLAKSVDSGHLPQDKISAIPIVIP